MADYITKESVHTMIRHLTKFAWRSPTWDERRVTVDTDDVHFGVDKIPSADVAPVVHGRWDDSGRYTFPGGSTAVRCTNCGCALTESEYRLNNWNYCPVCGAKMDEGGNEDGRKSV